jgi:hypothetical protein
VAAVVAALSPPRNNAVTRCALPPRPVASSLSRP